MKNINNQYGVALEASASSLTEGPGGTKFEQYVARYFPPY